MRSFRRDPVNLGDTRIAYLFLFSISLVCAVIGMISVDLRERLQEAETAGIRTALYECTDSLRAWSDAESTEARSEAVSRFCSAVMLLPDGVDPEPLLTLAGEMRAGTASGGEIRRLHDALSVLAATDFSDGAAARRTIRDAVSGVIAVTAEAPERDASMLPAVDTSWYSYKEAVRIASGLFGTDTGAPVPVRAADGAAWICENENLRIRFSAFDGSPESLVYIRLGAKPDEIRSDDELCERAGRFIGYGMGLGDPSEAEIIGDTGGFVRIALRCGGDDYRAVLDRHGRVWSVIKVKR